MGFSSFYLRLLVVLLGQRKRVCFWHLRRKMRNSSYTHAECVLCVQRKEKIHLFCYELRHAVVRRFLRKIDSLQHT
jgi:hypothetical protein